MSVTVTGNPVRTNSETIEEWTVQKKLTVASEVIEEAKLSVKDSLPVIPDVSLPSPESISAVVAACPFPASLM